MKKKVKLFIFISIICSHFSCNTIFETPEEFEFLQNNNWKLIWEENFNESLIDSTYWSKTPRIDHALWAMHMTENDTCYSFENGALVLKGFTNNFLKSDQIPFLTGGLQTKGKKIITTGRVEVRAKMNRVNNAWPAIWLLNDDRKWKGEIDIMETFDNYPSNNFITQSVHSIYTIDLGIKTNPIHLVRNTVQNKSEYNIYGVIINDVEVILYVNNIITFIYPKLNNVEEGQFPFTDPKHLILSMQLGHPTEGSGSDLKDLPAEMHIDWVRYYKKIDYTIPDY
jgi:beta-glucanase (GH16 family)